MATPQLNPPGNGSGGLAADVLVDGEGLRPTRPEHDTAEIPMAAANIDVQNRRRVSLGRTTVPTTKCRSGEDRRSGRLTHAGACQPRWIWIRREAASGVGLGIRISRTPSL